MELFSRQIVSWVIANQIRSSYIAFYKEKRVTLD